MTEPAATARGFRPPTAEQVRDHLAAHTPRARPSWLRQLPIALLVVTVLVSLSSQTLWAALLPWLALAGLVAFGSKRMRTTRSRQRRARRTQELAMLRYRREALRLGWTLLPELIYDPAEHGRVVTVLAHLLDDLGDPDAALIAFEHMLGGLPAEHPGAFAINVQRAILFLHTDRLADGDDTLRKLRNHSNAFEETPLGAAYHFARLVQAVKTHHFEEAIGDVPDAVATFRPLGVEAGYPHGLLAFCLDQLGRVEEAQTAWSHATLLLPAASLTARFPELHTMAARSEAPTGGDV